MRSNQVLNLLVENKKVNLSNAKITSMTVHNIFLDDVINDIIANNVIHVTSLPR